MVTKRTKTKPNDKHKRLKLDETVHETTPLKSPIASPDTTLFEVTIGDDVYIKVDKLFKHDLFRSYVTKHYNRSIAQLLHAKQLNPLVVVAHDLDHGTLTIKETFNKARDLRLIKKDGLFDALMMEITSTMAPMAPARLTDPDLVFFVDATTNQRHHVEMRGIRTMEGIYFKAKDVGRVFQSDRFVESIQLATSSYLPNVDYIGFTMPHEIPLKSDTLMQNPNYTGNLHQASDPRNSDISTSTKYQLMQELFLTFDGLMHALHCTRSPVAKKFKKWVYNTVFAITYGTPKQKKAIIQQLCRVDKAFLEAFLKLVPTTISCLYLVNTGQSRHGKLVYKYGCTENVKERFYKHSVTFGEAALLDTVVFVPEDALFDAETRFKKSVMKECRIQLDKQVETLLLDPEQYKCVREIMQAVADKYNGSLSCHIAVTKLEMNEQARQYEMRIKDLEKMVDVLKIQLEKAATDSDLKAVVSLGEYKDEAAIRLEQEQAKVLALEKRVIQLEAEQENAKLRMRVLELEHAAAMARNEPLQDDVQR